ncbi:hypothetical protein ACJ73_00420 [Blastomyces percursus]|uniref:C2H2-type domain-containing protein n=1 Tax=Blastomyces percursus TaxID=1658174 RepID=A0A1J9RI06_9EURO|nr:hypothetical protein ACJ73_00420 [Blastomyces percursus]
MNVSSILNPKYDQDEGEMNKMTAAVALTELSKGFLSPSVFLCYVNFPHRCTMDCAEQHIMTMDMACYHKQKALDQLQIDASTTNSKISQVQPASLLPVRRKRRYPCPYAALHSCGITFGTSNHARRHGKKHTGEKPVYCPQCNKRFARKDNMKQHCRAHLSISDNPTSKEDRDASRRDSMSWSSNPVIN